MRFSVTQLKQFARCPYSYFLKYIEGIKTGGSINLVVGRAIHKGFEFALKSIQKTGSFDIAEAYAVVRREFFKNIREGSAGEDLTEKDLKEAIQRLKIGREALKQYDFPKKHEILSVEEKFVVGEILDNTEITGYPDLITTDAVIDFKTKFRTPSEVDKGDFFQVGFYATFGDIDRAKLVYIILLKRGVKIIERVFEGEELETAKKLAQHLLKIFYVGKQEAEATGVWLPSGFSTGVCNWCEYAKTGMCEFGCGGKIEI